MTTPVYLNYQISDNNGYIDADQTHNISYIPASDGEDADTKMRNLLKGLFVVKAEDGSYDTSAPAEFYVGEYDAKGDDFVGFDSSSDINEIVPILKSQAEAAGHVTNYENYSSIIVTFMRDANADDVTGTDYFDELVKYVKKEENELRNKGFTQADINADTVEYSCNHCIVINIPENGVDYIAIT